MVENQLPTIRKSPSRIVGLDQILQGGLCTKYVADHYQIEVIDVLLDFEAALKAQIDPAPAVLRVALRPVTLFGVLTDESKVLTALGLKRANYGT